MDARTAKTALRKTIKAKLKALSDEDITKQSHTASKSVFDLPQYQQASNLSVYLSMPGSEIQTTSIVTRAFEDRKNVFVPYISKADGTMDMLRLRDVADFEALKPDSWGIPSLPSEGLAQRDRATGELDLLLMPAVAFDSKLRRLGHGKGYYDRYLDKYQSEGTGKMPFIVGLGLNEQVLTADETIPITDHDWLVDAVIQGDGSVVHRNP